MSNFINYSRICQDLLKDLSPRTKDIISRRFGFRTGQRETLESIGQSHNITRERTRQIEKDGLSRIKRRTDRCQKVFKYLAHYFKNSGGLKREDILLSQLGGKRFQPNLFFLLNLNDQFHRFSETEEFYPFWTIDQKILNLVQGTINFLTKKLAEKKEPLFFKQIYKIFQDERPLDSRTFLAFVEISKKIERGIDNFYGLKDWPEINPRGLKDKAFLALKKEDKPLHFRKVALLIDKLKFYQEPENQKRVLSQTVHNELIKDPRFILVGRGVYALQEWGYTPGYVKDIIKKLLEEKGKFLGKEEIVEEVLKQRLVKTSTILLNLQNKQYFLKNSEGCYSIKKA